MTRDAQSQSVAEGNAREVDAGEVHARRVSDDPKAKKPRRWLRVLAVVVAMLVVIVATLAIAFAWDRWWRYDDAADIQGQWFARGTAVSVQIDDHEISFDENTCYSYEIDPHEKTIRYQLANLKGQGRYWFAQDRSALVIEDGEGYTATSTATDDLSRAVGAFFGSITGNPPDLPSGDNVIVLVRTPDLSAPAPEAAADKEASAEDAQEGQSQEEQTQKEQAQDEQAQGEQTEGEQDKQSQEGQPSEQAEPAERKTNQDEMLNVSDR